MDTLVDQLAQHVCSTFGKPKSFTIPNLCGGFKYFLFSPLPGEDESNLTCAYFSNGVGEKPPTRNQCSPIFIFPFRESLRGFPQILVRSTPPLLEKNPSQKTTFQVAGRSRNLMVTIQADSPLESQKFSFQVWTSVKVSSLTTWGGWMRIWCFGSTFLLHFLFAWLTWDALYLKGGCFLMGWGYDHAKSSPLWKKTPFWQTIFGDFCRPCSVRKSTSSLDVLEALSKGVHVRVLGGVMKSMDPSFLRGSNLGDPWCWSFWFVN